MPLRDHFHPPLSVQRHWHGFHNAWATFIAADLNQRLPPGYFAEPNVQFGIEIDVATFQEPLTDIQPLGPIATWTAPAPVLSVPFVLTSDVVEVEIFSDSGGPTLTAAIELVSPANKDRPAHRAAFVAKCETYLRQGISLIIVDIVGGRNANLHNDLLRKLTLSVSPLAANLHAVAYRVLQVRGVPQLDIWPETLTLGRSLPTLPLWLQNQVSVPVDLNLTYEQTCASQRIRDNGAG